MDFTNAIKIILRDIEEARSLLNEAANASHITEIELAKARLHSAAEMLLLVPRLAEKNGKTEEPEPEKKILKQETSIQAPPAEPARDTVPDHATAEKPEVTAIPAGIVSAPSESKTEPVKEMMDQKTVQEDILQIKEEHKDTPPSAQQIFADKFGTDTAVLGEQITAKPDKDVLTSLSNKPVEDITTAIGINDRFFFTRELFGGKQEEYYKTISQLNKAAGFDEAMDILDRGVIGNPDVLAYTAFTDILKRKFPGK